MQRRQGADRVADGAGRRRVRASATARRRAPGRRPAGRRRAPARSARGRRRRGRRPATAQHVERVLRRQRRHVDDFEPRGAVAQQPERAGDVAAGQHEAVAAGRQAVDEVVQDAAKPGKLSNVRISRNSSSSIVTGSPLPVRGAAEEVERGVERGAGAGRRRLADRERRRRDDGLAGNARASSPCARRRGRAPTSGRAVRAAAGAASCGRCRIRRRERECATATRRALPGCGV